MNKTKDLVTYYVCYDKNAPKPMSKWICVRTSKDGEIVGYFNPDFSTAGLSALDYITNNTKQIEQTDD